MRGENRNRMYMKYTVEKYGYYLYKIVTYILEIFLFEKMLEYEYGDVPVYGVYTANSNIYVISVPYNYPVRLHMVYYHKYLKKNINISLKMYVKKNKLSTNLFTIIDTPMEYMTKKIFNLIYINNPTMFDLVYSALDRIGDVDILGINYTEVRINSDILKYTPREMLWVGNLNNIVFEDDQEYNLYHFINVLLRYHNNIIGNKYIENSWVQNMYLDSFLSNIIPFYNPYMRGSNQEYIDYIKTKNTNNIMKGIFNVN